MMPAGKSWSLPSSRGLSAIIQEIVARERRALGRQDSVPSRRSRLLGSRDDPRASSRAQDGVADVLWKEPNCHASQVMDGRSRLDRSHLDPDRTGIVRPVARSGAGAKPAKGAKNRRKSPRPESPKDEPKSDSQPEKRKGSGSHFPTIQLNLVIAGLGTEGCDVEVKPANAGCKFRPSSGEHVASDGQATIKLRDVELRGADKTCTMAITVREPGQPPQTIYRGFRPGSSKSGAVPSFTCFVSSTLAGADAKTTRK